MSLTDPIADMLTRIRNAIMAKHDSVLVPISRTKLAIAKVLKDEGFIQEYEVLRARPQRMLKIRLKYKDQKGSFISVLERVSKPGLRVYVNSREIPRLYGGMGVAILSTSKGVMTGEEAWRRHLGGELMCYVW